VQAGGPDRGVQAEWPAGYSILGGRHSSRSKDDCPRDREGVYTEFRTGSEPRPFRPPILVDSAEPRHMVLLTQEGGARVLWLHTYPCAPRPSCSWGSSCWREEPQCVIAVRRALNAVPFSCSRWRRCAPPALEADALLDARR